MTPEERKEYDRKRLKIYKYKEYWEQQEKRFESGIRQYRRRPDFSKESLCRKCGTIWPKCSRCPDCHISVKNAERFRKKDEVFRH